MCSVCNGYPNCPVCSEEPYKVLCPGCDGNGYTYYDDDGNYISKEQYLELHPHDRYREPCDYCDGVGEIEFIYEPDYDNCYE